MRLAPLLLLAGCAGWADPTAEDLRRLGDADRRPAYVRGKAVVDVSSPWFTGQFTTALVARTGGDPAVRLQLIPDLGGKAVDLFMSPTRLRGRFPHTGEELDWALPEQARPHPLLFIGITVLEEFASVVPRVVGAQEEKLVLRRYLVRGLVPPTEVEFVLWPLPEGFEAERVFHWRGGTWRLTREHEVLGPGVTVRIRERALVEAGSDVESLLK